MKPFVNIKDIAGNLYTLEFNVESKLTSTVMAVLLTGTLLLKDGNSVTVKAVKESGGVFHPRLVRIIGNIATTEGEIAAQLNFLFAEE